MRVFKNHILGAIISTFIALGLLIIHNYLSDSDRLEFEKAFKNAPTLLTQNEEVFNSAMAIEKRLQIQEQLSWSVHNESGNIKYYFFDDNTISHNPDCYLTAAEQEQIQNLFLISYDDARVMSFSHEKTSFTLAKSGSKYLLIVELSDFNDLAKWEQNSELITHIIDDWYVVIYKFVPG